MGVTYKEQVKLDEAIACYQKALSLKPDHADTYNNMGIVLNDQGKSEDAIQAYKKALAIRPNYAQAHQNLCKLIKYTSKNHQITQVYDLLKQSDLSESDQCLLHYAYAKMKEDLGDLGAAFDHYVTGGKLRKKLLAYDFYLDQNLFVKIKNIANELKDFAFNKPIKAAANTPIFILGMPRSGTTLIEQIISSHSKVHGAGELPFLPRFGSSLGQGNQIISSDNVLQIRNAYLYELENVSNGCQFVTDKLPQNFMYIALIDAAFPDAKIVHVQRNAEATCWSNFKHCFSAKGLGYSFDLKDTVNYFKLYQDLMEFWDKQYSAHIYHLDYDRLTLEQEPETRKLIEHLELDWEDNCLSPQENMRSVRTASKQQVRQKVYTGSSQAWRKFEPYLDGAFDELLT